MRDLNGNKVPSLKVRNKRAVRDFLMKKAAELPVMYEDHASSMSMTGAEMLKRNEVLDALSKEQLESIVPDKVYQVPAKLTRRVDHYERMLNLAKKKGPDAAVVYYNEVINAAMLSMKPVTIGNVKTEVDFGSPVRNY